MLIYILCPLTRLPMHMYVLPDTHTHHKNTCTHTQPIQMKRNKIKFQIISPPAEDEIISAIMDHACARLSSVNEQTIQATKPHAEKVKLVFMVMPSRSVIVCTCFRVQRQNCFLC